jgi:putative PIN family toxin of toxin-antitoxin system
MRIVLDTNQLVSALLRPPELGTLIMAWEAARFTIVASRELLDEYMHVLVFPDIASRVYPELLRAFKTHLVDDIELVAPNEVPHLCRDPDDDKVLAVAIHGLVNYLVTIDEDLLTVFVRTLLSEMGINVINGDELLRLLDRERQ